MAPFGLVVSFLIEEAQSSSLENEGPHGKRGPASPELYAAA